MSEVNGLKVNDDCIPVFLDDSRKLKSLQNQLDELLVTATLIDYKTKLLNASNFNEIIFMKDKNEIVIHFQHTHNINGKSNTKVYCTHNDDVVFVKSLISLISFF